MKMIRLFVLSFIVLCSCNTKKVTDKDSKDLDSLKIDDSFNRVNDTIITNDTIIYPN